MQSIGFTPRFSRIFIFATILFSLPAFAGISVSPMLINITSTHKKSMMIAVKNLGKQPEYIAITPYMLTLQKHSSSLKKIRLIDPRLGILVFPSKLSLAAKEVQYVRILLTRQADDAEHQFLIDFVPKIAGLTVNKGVQQQEVGLHVILAYEVRVILRPKHAAPKIRYKKLKQQIIITNNGNTSFVINQAFQIIKGKKQALKPSCLRVYAKQHCSIPLINKSITTHVTTFYLDKPYKALSIT